MRTMRQIRLASLVVAASLLALGGTAVAAPRPRTTGGITGSVQLPSGAPAVGVKVEAFHNESTENPQEPNMVLAGTTTTDAQGAYAFTRLASGDYRVKLTPSDAAYAFRYVDDDDLSATPWHGEAIMVAGTTVTAPLVKLFPAGTMTGLVLEEGTGKPLAGMTVQLTFQAPSRINPLAVGTTAADGTFRISQLPPTGAAAGPGDRATGSIIGLEFDSLDVWPWVIDPTGWHRDAVGWNSLTFPTLIAGATVDLGTPVRMTLAAKVSGVVLDARGRPIAGIQAIAVQAFSEWGRVQWQPVDYAAQKTDAKGRFTMTVTPGVALRIKVMDGRITDGRSQVLDAWATEYWPAAPVAELAANVVGTAGKTSALATPFTLERGAGFEGVVTGPGVSEPWSQGMFPWVSMLVNGTWYQAAYTYVFADGWYGFDGLPAGTYRVNFGTSIPIGPNGSRFYGEDWPEKPSGQGDPITLAAGDHRYGIDEWVDPVMLHLTADVTQGGMPAQGVQVQVVRNGGPGGQNVPIDGPAFTNQDGHAELWVPVSAQAGQPFGYGVQFSAYGPQGPQQRWEPVYGPYVAGQTIEQSYQVGF